MYLYIVAHPVFSICTHAHMHAGGDNETTNQQQAKGTFTVKAGLAQMLKGGIIMDVVTASQARIAEEAGACAVMALEKVPADIRRDGGVARMADPKVRVSNL